MKSTIKTILAFSMTLKVVETGNFQTIDNENWEKLKFEKINLN